VSRPTTPSIVQLFKTGPGFFFWDKHLLAQSSVTKTKKIIQNEGTFSTCTNTKQTNYYGVGWAQVLDNGVTYYAMETGPKKEWPCGT
jgi:hypothetical protein